MVIKLSYNIPDSQGLSTIFLTKKSNPCSGITPHLNIPQKMTLGRQRDSHVKVRAKRSQDHPKLFEFFYKIFRYLVKYSMTLVQSQGFHWVLDVLYDHQLI